ncbi:MAG: aminomethyl-transferring glycine dehydrogenase [Verrucomicrobia bacterium]|nr:aminomethyl-transferring glycine dehydrogenase [Verrucomicrobiota bacterium]
MSDFSAPTQHPPGPGPAAGVAEAAWTDSFVRRHIGPSPEAIRDMLETVGYGSLEALAAAAVPKAIRRREPLRLPAATSEQAVLEELKALASRNRVWRSHIGLGYYDCFMPPVIQRNILENPGWYTAYTPYQAEISQGRLEALLNFQTMVGDLTGLEIANASLLDDATAAAEAMIMCHALKGRPPARAFWVSAGCHPHVVAVVRTRAEALGIRVLVGPGLEHDFAEPVFGVLVADPATDGSLGDYESFAVAAHAHGALVIAATDLLVLTLLRPPGEWGADVAVGSAQRFGVPLGYGGPHAAFLATRAAFKRQMPGRLVGVSRDARGRPALRLALQTREQHIRREKATSNICTAQALPAILASMYAVYHGPAGLRRIAQRVHALALTLAAGLRRLGCHVTPEPFFDTLFVQPARQTAAELRRRAEAGHINLRHVDEQTVGIALDETTTAAGIETILRLFHEPGAKPADGRRREAVTPHATAPDGAGVPSALDDTAAAAAGGFPPPFARGTPFLQHPVFNRHQSETEMLRYMRRLEARDLSLTTSMIPLGSCTMKLNAAVEMAPITWPEFAGLHPFAPVAQAAGYQALFHQLAEWLAEITGLAAVSLQPNAGSQGELTGLLVIRRYHARRGAPHRNVCLIPTSAHGTNPASAVLAGFTVVPVACAANGDIDLADLRAKAAAHAADLGVLMVTYPSTHGVFEEAIQEICRVVHDHGGQVYLDGANLNAQVGLCRPGDMGADVCHLNLHKTFCIPHGGGGPGMGPIAVAAHLAPFLPTHPLVSTGGAEGMGPVAAAPWGSASLLPITWVYLRLMGAAGLTRASQVAILNANYVARRLHHHYPVLYRGAKGLVAHECILDLRQFKTVTVEDAAKRLMDYGFHAPTMSWPVPGTFMVEPTESESKAELDRFCDAMLAIHAEIAAIESGRVHPADNPLKNAPHTADTVAADAWDRPYSRRQAAYPAPWLEAHKYWPPVGRVDNVYGDRNPVCRCPEVT